MSWLAFDKSELILFVHVCSVIAMAGTEPDDKQQSRRPNWIKLVWMKLNQSWSQIESDEAKPNPINPTESDPLG